MSSGKDYLPLFSRLTRAACAESVMFYDWGTRPDVSGCRLARYETVTRTNWRYACASDLVVGRIGVA